MFKSIDGLSGKLKDPLTVAGTTISANIEFINKLESTLSADGDYTFLSLVTPSGQMEIIKVANILGQFVVTRGLGTTTALNAPKGSCLKFEMNSVVVSEIVQNAGIIPAVCEVIAGTGLTLVKDGCKHTLSVVHPTCAPITYMGSKFSIVNGCLEIEEPINCGCNIANGTYENATVTIKDGRICAIQTGANPQYIAPSCTCCNCAPATP